VFPQESLGHTEVELLADTILIDVEGVLTVRESDVGFEKVFL
jgi:hypothetical protein